MSNNNKVSIRLGKSVVPVIDAATSIIIGLSVFFTSSWSLFERLHPYDVVPCIFFKCWVQWSIQDNRVTNIDLKGFCCCSRHQFNKKCVFTSTISFSFRVWTSCKRTSYKRFYVKFVALHLCANTLIRQIFNNGNQYMLEFLIIP